jgi:hypothetical protein
MAFVGRTSTVGQHKPVAAGRISGFRRQAGRRPARPYIWPEAMRGDQADSAGPDRWASATPKMTTATEAMTDDFSEDDSFGLGMLVCVFSTFETS